MKNETIADIQLDVGSTREYSRLIEEWLNNDSFHIVEVLNMQGLVDAGENSEAMECLKRSDLVIPQGEDLLELLDDVPEEDLDELKSQELLVSTLHRITDEGHTVFFLTNTAGNLREVKSMLGKIVGDHLNIAGEYILKDSDMDPGDVINSINSVTPDVVFSILKSPENERFLKYGLQMINASLWVSVSIDIMLHHKKRNPLQFYRRMMNRKKLQRQKEEEEEKSQRQEAAEESLPEKENQEKMSSGVKINDKNL